MSEGGPIRLFRIFHHGSVSLFRIFSEFRIITHEGGDEGGREEGRAEREREGRASRAGRGATRREARRALTDSVLVGTVPCQCS